MNEQNQTNEETKKRGRPPKKFDNITSTMPNIDIELVPQTKNQNDDLRKDFEEFKQSVNDTQNKIIDILERMQNKEEVRQEKEPELKDEPIMPMQVGFLPPNYKKIFDNYFDAEDGFEASFDFPEQNANGGESGGLTFTIKVPEKMSNMIDAQKNFYKVDLRTVVLKPNNIAKGIDDWCKKVAQNLKYNKKFKFK